ncbi:MAG: DMP19 family protein [Phycisphaerae bacterium]|nr:DMP19 family protein [Phycisphaerae bacterium]
MTDKRMVVDDEVIDSGDIQAIIDPVWLSVDIYSDEETYRRSLSKFSKPQQYVITMWWYMAEVNNGGHDQFYFNSTGIVWEDALYGFGKVGLGEIQQILKESVDRFNCLPDKDRYKRQEQLDGLDFEDLDSRFYELQENMDIEAVLLTYIRNNRAEFYFDGMVKGLE